MKTLKVCIAALLITSICLISSAQDINVYIKVRGTTGLEEKLKDIVVGAFSSLDKVAIIDKKEDSHLYLDLSLVEQEPIHFYGLGICIAYHINDSFYSRPTSDVAQFGEERMEDVCRHLVSEIDKAFIEPLRNPE